MKTMEEISIKLKKDLKMYTEIVELLDMVDDDSINAYIDFTAKIKYIKDLIEWIENDEIPD